MSWELNGAGDIVATMPVVMGLPPAPEWTINLPQGGPDMATAQNITFTIPDAGFNTRTPRPDNIKAVKLTEDNLREVGAYALRVRGGAVEVIDLESGLELRIGSLIFRPGQWLVEDYSYALNRVQFRRAQTWDREKYELR